MGVYIDDGHPKLRTITVGKQDNGVLTSRVLQRGDHYTAIVVGVVVQQCDTWEQVKGFLQAMGIDQIPAVSPAQDFEANTIRH